MWAICNTLKYVISNVTQGGYKAKFKFVWNIKLDQ